MEKALELQQLVPQEVRRYRSIMITIEAHQVKQTGPYFVEGKTLWVVAYDWVIRHDDGKVEIVKPADFHNRFEPLPPLSTL